MILIKQVILVKSVNYLFKYRRSASYWQLLDTPVVFSYILSSYLP
jgi:hypothetical protein